MTGYSTSPNQKPQPGQNRARLRLQDAVVESDLDGNVQRTVDQSRPRIAQFRETLVWRRWPQATLATPVSTAWARSPCGPSRSFGAGAAGSRGPIHAKTERRPLVRKLTIPVTLGASRTNTG